MPNPHSLVPGPMDGRPCEAPHFAWVRGVAEVSRVTGCSPARLIRAGSSRDDRARCVLVGWLVIGMGHPTARVAQWMGVPEAAIHRILIRLDALRIGAPEVSAWLGRLRSEAIPAPFVPFPSGGPVYIETQHRSRKMGFAALWMTLETGAAPLNLWGSEMGTKAAAQWATLWWLHAAKGLDARSLCEALDLHPREAVRMLQNLQRLASRRPEVRAWMNRISRTTRGEAAG